MAVEPFMTHPVDTGRERLWWALGIVTMAVLGYEAISWYWRSPMQYLLNVTPAAFGPFWPRRWTLLLHIGGGTLALFAGPFQFWSGLRRRHLGVHRMAGYVFVSGVGVGGAAAFHLSLFTQPPDFGIALFMLAFAWWLTVAMALVAIRRGRTEPHREWMTRAYVVTFAFVAFRVLFDWPVWRALGPAASTTVAWLCWVPSLLVTEVVLQWRRTVGTRRAPPRPVRAA